MLASGAPRWRRGGLALALAGATLGTALDAVHVQTATTAYSAPDLFGQPWWVPLLFAAAAVAIGLGRPLAERLLDRLRPAPAPRAVAIAMAVLVAAYVLSGTVAGGATTLVLAACFVLVWLLCDRSGLGLALALAAAAGGVAVEVGLVAAGVFHYLAPQMLGVASWLPWLYGCAAVALGGLGKRLVDA